MERAPSALAGAVFWPATGDRECRCYVLHGYGMRAADMLDWIRADTRARLSHVEFVFLQAPARWQTSPQTFGPSWLAYVEEFDGREEDRICEEALEDITASLAEAIGLAQAPTTAVVGLSEGGCLALHLATRLPLKAVVTMVAHRLRESAASPLLCPWHALTAARDEVYPEHLTAPHLNAEAQAVVWEKVEDDHYLHHSSDACADFLSEALVQAFGRPARDATAPEPLV